ncbi:MAG TPA: Eco57I restriction-modification methylase domain-containing protein, partial [Candidatus Nitrosocosmicus sp.]|nr:Eco57I restriction-modification methylase domain-containing protein [Candidatus Nitrosocosmicus sp.]
MTAAISVSDNISLQNNDEETKLKFLALAFAVLQAKERLEKKGGISSMLHLLNIPEISYAVSALPTEMRNKFSNWFRGLSEGDLNDISKAYNWRELHINIIGNQLFSSDIAKEKGAIFTPDWLAQRVTNEAIRYWKRLNPGKGNPRRVGDLSCGAGVFLSYLKKLVSSDTEIIGVDSCAEYVCISRLNAVGDQQCSIECLDTLIDLHSEKQKSLFGGSETLPISDYDIIVGNPPYVRSQLLNASYSQKLKKLYPQLTKGNFDLVVLFLAQTLDALSSGGIGALIVSNKFMGSRYGDEICRRLANESRILEIIDFGDGQVFPDKTTYTCVITFAKLPPVGTTSVINFPPGLIWNDKGNHFELGQKLQIPQERFQSVPWNLAGNAHDEILRIMHRPNMPLLFDLFPNISQGVRTGANHIFVIKNVNVAAIEKELLQPYVSGENIRRCQIVSTNKYLLWLYKKDDQKVSNVIPANELEENYPKAWSYLLGFQKELADRELDSSIPWYGYSRTQNLELIHRPKILAREMMPWAEFAADI